MSYGENRQGHGYSGTIRRAKRVQARRSDWIKHIDSKLKAPKAKDIDRWLSAPNRFDLPKVETNKPKQDWTNFHLSLNCQKRDLLA